MKKLLLMLASIGVAQQVIATEGEDNLYVNANTGIATMSGLPTGSWTGSANFGYNLVPKYFGIEGGYTIITGNQFNDAQVTTNVFDVAVKGTLPLTDMFSLYGRAGVGYGMTGWNGTASGASNDFCNCNYDNNFGTGLVGIGASFKISRSFDLRVEDYAFIPFSSNTMIGNTNIVTVGTQYNF